MGVRLEELRALLDASRGRGTTRFLAWVAGSTSSSRQHGSAGFGKTRLVVADEDEAASLRRSGTKVCLPREAPRCLADPTVLLVVDNAVLRAALAEVDEERRALRARLAALGFDLDSLLSPS